MDDSDPFEIPLSKAQTRPQHHPLEHHTEGCRGFTLAIRSDGGAQTIATPAEGPRVPDKQAGEHFRTPRHCQATSKTAVPDA